jgi:Tol biopolymer transport system component
VLAQRITTDLGDDGGRVTPDGRLYVFTDWDTGDLAVRDLSTGAVTRLTNESKREKPGYWAWSPVASADGKRLAFAWVTGRNYEERYELRVINIDGSGMRAVLPATRKLWVLRNLPLN